MHKKILIMGLPGGGKTTLASTLVPLLGAVHFNADEVRGELWPELGYSPHARLIQAERMGWLCNRVVESGGYAVADFICPTVECRHAFGEAFVVWVDRPSSPKSPAHFTETQALWDQPSEDEVDYVWQRDKSALAAAFEIAALVRPTFNPRAPTALFVGRFQPFHAGHKALIEEGLKRVGQVCIAVRDTYGVGTSNPFQSEEVVARIAAGMREHEGKFKIVTIPNITAVYYGRDVGYVVERLEVDVPVSGTELRRKIHGSAV